MNALFALLGFPTWMWVALGILAVLCIVVALRMHHDSYADAKRLTDEIMHACSEKRAGLREKETASFTHYIFGTVKMQRRAWADVTASSGDITVWIEYSNLASEEEIAALRKLEEVLKAAGCKAFLHHLVADQPERPKNEIQPA